MTFLTEVPITEDAHGFLEDFEQGPEHPWRLDWNDDGERVVIGSHKTLIDLAWMVDDERIGYGEMEMVSRLVQSLYSAVDETDDIDPERFE